MDEVFSLIDNPLQQVNKEGKYTAIIGECPSKGARSPLLWNAAFKGLEISAMMHPFDISSEKLSSLVSALRDDKQFIGGAVTMPHKTAIVKHLDLLEPEAEIIGAVNCIYREGSMLKGANTDGAAALSTLEEAYGASLKGKNVILAGTGGAGTAVAVCVAGAIGTQGRLMLANRSMESRDALAEKLSSKVKVETVELPLSRETLKNVDILINCSSLGFEHLRVDGDGAYFLDLFTVLGPVNFKPVLSENGDSHEELKRRFVRSNMAAISNNFSASLNSFVDVENLFVFDIVYQPVVTSLIFAAQRAGLGTLSGLQMNLEQAVIAFLRAVDISDSRADAAVKVRTFMKDV